jgi:hypothetical protein
MEPIKVKVDLTKEKKPTYDIDDLIADACDTFDTDYWEDIKKGNYDVDDMIHEIADSAVPIYYYDIGQFAAHNSHLMTFKSELNPEGTPHDQIQSNIYSEIVDGLHAHIAKKEKEEEDEE